MRIAVVTPVLRKISKDNSYGGIERIVKSLVFGALKAGHDVTLYAPFGTDLKHKKLHIIFTTEQDIINKTDLIKKAENELFQRIVREQSNFDIIHTHIEPVVARINNDNYYAMIKKPIIVTMHNLSYIQDNINYYKNNISVHNINYVFISNDQLVPLNFLPKHTVIYNGINTDDLYFNAEPNNNQLVFLGRITPEKGISQAIEIAKLSNNKLLIAAAIDHSQQEFYDKQIKPQIDNKNIIFLGEVNSVAKNEILRTSKALLFPIQWHEPFGLVMVESMAVGTPVIAAGIGSVSEIVEDNKTGFIIKGINNIDEYLEKIEKIDQIDRNYCRRIVIEKFSEDTMILNYLEYYKASI